MIDPLTAALIVLAPAVAVAALKRLPIELLDEPLPASQDAAVHVAPAARPEPVSDQNIEDESDYPPVRRLERADEKALVTIQGEAIAAMVGVAHAIGTACEAFETDPESGAFQLSDRDVRVLSNTDHLFALALALPASEARH